MDEVMLRNERFDALREHANRKCKFCPYCGESRPYGTNGKRGRASQHYGIKYTTFLRTFRKIENINGSRFPFLQKHLDVEMNRDVFECHSCGHTFKGNPYPTFHTIGILDKHGINLEGDPKYTRIETEEDKFEFGVPIQ